MTLRVIRRTSELLFVALQVFWMLVVLPGHARGVIVMGPDRGCADRAAADRTASAVADAPACCAPDDKPFAPGDTPSPDRKSRCAVCYQAHGYTLPPVYAFDLVPTGLCALCRLIEPGVLRRLPCAPTYFANGPPARLV